MLGPVVMDMVQTTGGQRLLVAEWPGPQPVFVAIHGLTSTHRNFAAVAARLQGALAVVAPDLRGRGLSTKPPPGSYGIEAHARDVLDVMDSLGIDRAVVGGHSMGAYVATEVAARAPDRVLGLVLVDGGVYVLPPGMEDVDPDQWMEQLIGPVMERLRRTFATVEEYRAFWRSMPYWLEDWGPIVEDYLLYDCGRRGGAYASKCSEAAAVEDWRDLLTNPRTTQRLTEVKVPVLAVGAEMGLTPEGVPVLSDAHLEALRQWVGEFEFVRVPGTTHHTVTLSDKGAQATADAIRAFVARLPR